MSDRTSLDRISLELESTGLNLKQLYYFHAVATEGSIARAAKKLLLTQPTVSEQIRNLELYLETPLFDRRPGGLRLNHQGRRVLEHTQVMFRAVRRLIQDVNPKRSQDRLVLEVGVCSTISRTFSAERFLPLFQMKDLAPRIRYGGYDDLMERLLRGDLDLLLTENQPSLTDQEKVGLRALTESPLVAVAAPPLAQQVVNYPDDLGNLPFIHYTQSSRYRWDLDTFFLELGIAPEVLAEVDDVILLATAAEQGMCWVAIPETVARDGFAKGSLHRLGTVGSTRATVFAYFRQVNTPDVVMRAIAALQTGH